MAELVVVTVAAGMVEAPLLPSWANPMATLPVPLVNTALGVMLQ